MASEDSVWLSRAGRLSGWAFAAALVYAAIGPGSALFEGITWQRALVTFAFLVACAVYLIWLLATTRQGQREAASFPAALAPAAPAFLAALLAPPISRDPMLYLHYGSMVLDGVNPYLVRSGEWSGTYSNILHWDQTCAYGPLALGLFALVGSVQSPFLGVAILKLLWLAAHVGASYLFWRRRGPERTLLTQAYAFHPVLLFAFVADGHLDALAGLFLLAGFLALAEARARLALLAFCAATLTKSMALIVLPLWFAWALSRRDFRLAGFGLALLAAIGALLWATILPSAHAWLSLTNPVVTTGRSMQHVLLLSGERWGFDGERVGAAYVSIAKVMYLLGAGWVWLRAVRTASYTASQLAHDFALLLLVACLSIVPYVPWWYSAPVITAALWSRDAVWLRPVATTFGVCSAFTLAVGTAASTAGLMAALLSIVPTLAMLAWSALHAHARARSRSPSRDVVRSEIRSQPEYWR